MVIKNQIALTLLEVADLAKDTEKEKKMKDFIKLFVKGDIKKIREMEEELNKLEILKLKEEHIVKIADFKPEDAVDLTKVVPDVSFDQDEVNKILEIVKKY